VKGPAHLDELGRALITVAVLGHVVEAEVLRRITPGAGDDVPAGAAAADVIERGEAARDVIGRIKGRRPGGDKSDALGRGGERGQQDGRVEAPHRVRARANLSAFSRRPT
jgi:hypothetical protein